MTWGEGDRNGRLNRVVVLGRHHNLAAKELGSPW
jgi:hypothetical protein